MTIDHMTGYCRHHHPNYAKEGSPTKPATVGQALSAVAPDKNVDQPSTPSPGKRRGKKDKCNVTNPPAEETVGAEAPIEPIIDPRGPFLPPNNCDWATNGRCPMHPLPTIQCNKPRCLNFLHHACQTGWEYDNDA